MIGKPQKKPKRICTQQRGARRAVYIKGICEIPTTLWNDLQEKQTTVSPEPLQMSVEFRSCEKHVETPALLFEGAQVTRLPAKTVPANLEDIPPGSGPPNECRKSLFA